MFCEPECDQNLQVLEDLLDLTGALSNACTCVK